MKNKKLFINYLVILTAIILLASIHIWATVCTGTVELASGNTAPMKCHYTSVAETVLAIILIFVGIEGIIQKKLSFLTLISIGIFMILIPLKTPLSIGVCMKEMACHTTAVWTKASGGIIALLGVLGIFIQKD